MATIASGNHRTPQRILLIKPSSLGDIVHALPVLAGLRAKYPHAQIAWLAGNTFAPLLAGHTLLNEVIPFDRARYGRMLQSPRVFVEFMRFVWNLRKRRFDLVLDLQGLIRSGFLAWATGARQRVGPSEARELAWAFYTRRITSPDPEAHAVDKLLHLARALDLPVDPPQFDLGLSPDELTAARDRLTAAAQNVFGAGAPQAANRYIGIVLGARWDSKRWPLDRWAVLLDRLHAEGFPPCVLLGGPSDRTSADTLLSECRSPVLDLVGRTSLRALAALLAHMHLVICHDSGPMHIAAALRKPLVALFGPTSPRRTGPYSDTAHVVTLGLACAPCYRRQCPLGHHHCMRQLSVDAVLERVRELSAACPPDCRTSVPADR